MHLVEVIALVCAELLRILIGVGAADGDGE